MRWPMMPRMGYSTAWIDSSCDARGRHGGRRTGEGAEAQGQHDDSTRARLDARFAGLVPVPGARTICLYSASILVTIASSSIGASGSHASPVAMGGSSNM